MTKPEKLLKLLQTVIGKLDDGVTFKDPELIKAWQEDNKKVNKLMDDLSPEELATLHTIYTKWFDKEILPKAKETMVKFNQKQTKAN